MTVDEFSALQQRAAQPIATDRDLDAWVAAVLAGEPTPNAPDEATK